MTLGNRQLDRLISTLGTNQFEIALLDSMQKLAGADHCLLIKQPGGKVAPSIAITAGKINEALVQDCTNLYTSYLFRKDPINSFINDRLPEPEQPLVRIGIHDIKDSEYGELLFGRCNVIEELAMFNRNIGESYSLNLYRLSPHGPYDAESIRRISNSREVIFSLLNKHLVLEALDSPQFDLDWVVERLIESCSHALTAREIEICARIVLGYTSVAIGLDLCISVNTVLTHRRHAYDKLRINTQNQLFAILINGLSDNLQ